MSGVFQRIIFKDKSHSSMLIPCIQLPRRSSQILLARRQDPRIASCITSGATSSSSSPVDTQTPYTHFTQRRYRVYATGTPTGKGNHSQFAPPGASASGSAGSSTGSTATNNANGTVNNALGQYRAGKSPIASFQDFPLRREVQMGLARMGVRVPTKVQSAVIPVLLEKKDLRGNSDPLNFGERVDFRRPDDSTPGLNPNEHANLKHHRTSALVMGGTGTGKTLAYVAPLVHNLLESLEEGVHPMPNGKPRGLAIVPTRELAVQILETLRNFPIQSIACAPGQSFVKETRSLAFGVDFIVATPHRLMIHLQKKQISLSELECVVIDEADTLCDTFYEKDICKILAKMNKAAPPQVVLVGATRTGAVTNFMQRSLAIPLHQVTEESSHTVPANLEQHFVPTRGRMRKNVLAEIISEQLPGTKTLIFTNTVKTCRSLRQYLMDALGTNVHALHGHMSPRMRSQVVNGFRGNTPLPGEGNQGATTLSSEAYLASLPSMGERAVSENGDDDEDGDEDDDEDSTSAQTLGNDYNKLVSRDKIEAHNSAYGGVSNSVLIATNLASRGLDISDINHVIMYDVPHTMADYLHRVGRTARAGASGRVTTIMKKRDMTLVKQIQSLQANKKTASDSKYAGTSLRKIMALERYKSVLAYLKGKCKARKWKKQLGIPITRNLGSPENKALREKMEKRWKMNQLRVYLEMRGRIPRGNGIPKLPDLHIEASETNTVSTMLRCETSGRLQVIPKRRKLRDERTDIEDRELGKVIGEVGDLANVTSAVGQRTARGLDTTPGGKGGIIGKIQGGAPESVDYKQLPDLMLKNGMIETVKKGASGGKTGHRRFERSVSAKRKRPVFM